ncbi:MAG: hypothetical protein IJB70_03230 [Clostridia bacterium]|nr:hypothetical protein [Clostridia bacterium]
MRKSKYENELTTEYLIAEKVVCCQYTSGEEMLLNDTPPQAVLGTDSACIIKNGGYILLDFGVELCGGIRITRLCLKLKK